MASPDAVLHLAALHALASAGFASTSSAASMTLTDLIARYLRLLATTSVERAALAGRSKVAAVDVVQTLEDLGVGNVGELQEWALDLNSEVVFAGAGMDELADNLRDGLHTSDGPEIHYRPAELAQEYDFEDMDVDDEDEDDIVVKEERHISPESWLPPLPTEFTRTIDTTSSAPAIPNAPAPQTIAERYTRPIAYSSSQLAQSRPFLDPPKHKPRPLPPAPTSFPSLIESYSTSEPNPKINMSEMRYRQLNLLRFVISTPDHFSPSDTLSSPLPPPRSTPIVPSHSETIPQRLLPINPESTGILTSLVHKLNSPHLPPALRERLTSLRPPQPQMRDSKPILFGDSIRGPDSAALSKARGKPSETDTYDYLTATWDSGPRGMDKWGRGRLPAGRKVVQSGEGEIVPREAEENRKLRLKMAEAANAPSGIRIKLGSRRGSGTGDPSGETGSTPVPDVGVASNNPGEVTESGITISPKAVPMDLDLVEIPVGQITGPDMIGDRPVDQTVSLQHAEEVDKMEGGDGGLSNGVPLGETERREILGNGVHESEQMEVLQNETHHHHDQPLAIGHDILQSHYKEDDFSQPAPIESSVPVKTERGDSDISGGQREEANTLNVLEPIKNEPSSEISMPQHP